MLRVLGCIAYDHNVGLVVLAVVVCVVASLSALAMQSHRTDGRKVGTWWLAGAGMCFGFGVWATHFVSMLAFSISIPITYDVAYTVISAVIAVGGAVAAFALADRGFGGKLLGGSTLGGSVTAMHFLGMAGMHLPGAISYDLATSATAVVFAMTFGTVALFHQRAEGNPRRQFGTAVLLAFSVVGLHFTVMSGTTFVAGLADRSAGTSLDAGLLAVTVVSVTALVLALGVFAATLDKRADAEVHRTRQLASATFEGIVIHRRGSVLEANDAFYRMVGIPVGTAMQRSLQDFVAPEDMNVMRSQIAETGTGQVEITIVAADGARLPVEILTRPIERADGPAAVVAVRDLTERRRAEERVYHFAHHDQLTGLPNRRLLARRLSQALNGHGPAAAVMCLDLDRFKAVNDLLGHQGGDQLLVQVARRLEECTRAGEMVARLGGDEFAVLIPRLPAPEGVEALARRIVEALSRPFELDGAWVSIGASVGISLFPEDGATPDALVRSADTALYCAKESGRGTHRFFVASMERRMIERRHLERDLRVAAELGQLELFYQPIFGCDTGELLGYEALLRWNHPERGRIEPGNFIPLAEETGLIVTIGLWALEAACAEAAGWRQPLRVAVNLSPVQLRQTELLTMVAATLDRTGLAPDRLELEVTEGVFITEPEAAFEALKGIRALGVRIALDDFGSGYSSMSYLRQFPFDKNKIDRAFIQALGDDAEAQSIVDAILAMAHGLHMDVTAEGVETEEQLDRLRGRHCQQVQGYLLGVPVPASHLIKGASQWTSATYGLISRLGGNQSREAVANARLPNDVAA